MEENKLEWLRDETIEIIHQLRRIIWKKYKSYVIQYIKEYGKPRIGSRENELSVDISKYNIENEEKVHVTYIEYNFNNNDLHFLETNKDKHPVPFEILPIRRIDLLERIFYVLK